MGVGGAHPGGIHLTKKILMKEDIDQSYSILDAGCGTGQSSAYIAENYGCQVTSIDSNQLMVEKARKRFNTLNLSIETMVANTESLPFSNDSFDLVLSESVIIFTELSRTLKEFNRVLKPNGKLIAIEMVLEKSLSQSEQEEIMQFYEISRLLMEDEWKEEFICAGFKKVFIEREEEKINKLGQYNIPDFLFSEQIDNEVFFVMEKHELLNLKYLESLGFRVFTCYKESESIN
jgi:SAM-dependent methyltransferase